MKTELYRRVETGKRIRYELVGIDWTHEVMPVGSTLVTVVPTEHGRMTCTMAGIEPDRAAVLAAIREFESALVEVLRNEYRQRVSGGMTKRQRAAWDRFEAETGITSVMLTGPDAWAAATKAADVLKRNMKENVK